MPSGRDSPVPDAVSDLLSVAAFPAVDLFSEDFDDRSSGGRFRDVVEGGVDDAYSLWSFKLGFGSINWRSRREDRYCEDL